MPDRKSQDPLPHGRARGAIGAQLRAVVAACCREAARSDSAAPEREAVHAARRALKRARAVLRLGEALEVRGAKEARRRLGKLGRELGPLRDAAVTAKVVQRVEKRLPRRARRGLRGVAKGGANKPDLWWRRWRRRLAEEARRLEQLAWGAPSREEIDRALQESAKRVCRRATKARAKRKIRRAHAWRKAVIALREQIAVMRPLLGNRGSRVHARLDRLAKCLGRAMDYHVFVQTARRRHATRGATALGECRRRRAIRRAAKEWPKTKRLMGKCL